MKVAWTHDWSLTPALAAQLQNELRGRVAVQPAPANVDLVAGVDAGFSGGLIHAAIVVLSYPNLELVEQQTVAEPVTFPYVPGLLSFREAPAILRAAERLAHEPDLILVDGHGLAHPRRLGIASHLGVVLDKPAIGCAKSRLVGEHEVPGDTPGSWVPLSHRGEGIGAVVRSKPGSKPIYVSVGHRVDLAGAIAFCLATTEGYRLPKPIRLAHLAAAGSARQSSSDA